MDYAEHFHKFRLYTAKQKTMRIWYKICEQIQICVAEYLHFPSSRLNLNGSKRSHQEFIDVREHVQLQEKYIFRYILSYHGISLSKIWLGCSKFSVTL